MFNKWANIVNKKWENFKVVENRNKAISYKNDFLFSCGNIDGNKCNYLVRYISMQ